MKEITFLKQNYQRWQQFEDMLGSDKRNDPDALADLFIRITDDLSWARTFYPGSNTEKYLNDLAARIHQEIYKNKKERRSRLLTFWSHEIPLIMAKNRMNLLIVFIMFALSTWIGVISAKHDEGFVRIILGDRYVDETLERMGHGDPLGVYKDESQFVMFFQIALNNSMVALMCVVAGLLGWMGVGFLQFRNGVMLGAFLYFLSDQGFYREAMLTVWIHGTIEISCILIAGAAGMAFGKGLWFPGAWPRGLAFMRSTREALKIGVGLIPFFFLAAFFEGFVTRYTEMNDYGRMAIIFTSLAFVLWYFVIWPFFVEHRKEQDGVLVLGYLPVIGRLFRYSRYANKEFSTRVAFLLLLSLLLLLLPSLAILMQFFSKQKADPIAWVFFSISFTAGIGLCVYTFMTLGKTEEKELQIARKEKNNVSVYEREATSTKV